MHCAVELLVMLWPSHVTVCRVDHSEFTTYQVIRPTRVWVSSVSTSALITLSSHFWRQVLPVFQTDELGGQLVLRRR